MSLSRRLLTLAGRAHLPRRTVRLRLTLLYGALFLVSGAALLAITYVLVSHRARPVLVSSRTAVQTQPDIPELRRIEPGESVPGTALVPPELREQARRLREQAAHQRAKDLQQLLIQSGTALGLMTVISIGLGWLMAGRVLRPLRTMTATTRRISEHNLHERLALEGPPDELKDLGDTIDGLLGRLEAAFEAQRRFVANASHELRTPLAMMRTSLDVAVAKPDRVPEVDVLGGKLREGLDRADRLLEGFLALARAQHGALPADGPVPLGEVLAAAVDERAEAIAARAIEVRRELEHVAVTGSRTLLAHLAANLVDNAVRHNEIGGWMRIATRAEGDTARLVVESGGPRLAAHQVRALAQPFRRLAAERTGSENGVGLGLSIVAAIAAAHGGRLELRARAEGGLRAEIELARVRPALPAGEPA